MTTEQRVTEKFLLVDGPSLHKLFLSHQLHLANHLGDFAGAHAIQDVFFSAVMDGQVVQLHSLTITGLTAGKQNGVLDFTASCANAGLIELRGSYTPKSRCRGFCGMVTAVMQRNWRYPPPPPAERP